MVDYKEGDRIIYTNDAGEKAVILVTSKEEDIKNGEPGWEGVRETTSSVHWGYDSQVEGVCAE